MKKFFYMLASFAVVSSILTGCGNSDNQEELERLRAENEALKASASATEEIISEAETSTTTEITTTVIETTTMTETTTAKPKTVSVWEKNYFVDEWGDEDKNSPYLYTETSNGKFSNSATVNSELTVGVIVSDDYAGFILYEYGYSDVVSSSGEEYKITVIDESDSETSLEGWIGKNSNQVCVLNSEYSGTNDFDSLLDLLKTNNTLKFKFEEQGKYSNDVYSFKLDCSGFETSYDDMIG